MLASDWTERYRPVTESELEGNKPARIRIRNWLESWDKGTPSKRGLLLHGPPGIGKTSIVRAIANDRGWVVVELNASDARNAAAIRKAIGGSSTSHAFSLDGTFGGEGSSSRTLILLDEVDHLHGGLATVAEKRISDSMTNMTGEITSAKSLAGDSGGKGELLRILKESKQPIIMTCNELMGLWGKRNSRWRDAKTRFEARAEVIEFRRVDTAALIRIAVRILKAENVTYDKIALDRLANANPGDFRSVVRDLQMICEGGVDHVDMRSVDEQIARGVRDTQLAVFEGVSEIYRTNTSKDAHDIVMNLDITPNQFVNWASMNNKGIQTGREVLLSGIRTLSKADHALSITFLNRAYRSWYWAGALAAHSTTPPGMEPLEKKPFLLTPSSGINYSSMRRKSMMSKLANTCGCSEQAAKEDLYPSLSAIHEGGNIPPERFDISQRLGLDASEHLMLHGLKKSLKSSKELADNYSKSTQVTYVEQPLESEEDVDEESVKKEIPKGQQKLDFF